jgi:hypothetical protein
MLGLFRVLAVSEMRSMDIRLAVSLCVGHLGMRTSLARQEWHASSDLSMGKALAREIM